MKKILIFSHEFPPVTGGAGTVAYQYAVQFALMNYEVEVLTSYQEDKVNSGQFKVIHNKIKNKFWFLGYKNIVDFDKYDVIFLNDPSAIYVGGMFFSEKLLNKSICFLHGSEPERIYENPTFLRKISFFKYFFTKALFSSKAIISPSHYMKEKFLNSSNLIDLNGKIKVVYYGLDCALFLNKKNKISRSSIGINESQEVLISVSRITKQKGYFTMYNIFKKLVKKYKKDFIWIIIGDGDFLYELKQMVIEDNLEKKVLFIGKVNREELVDYYKISDLFWLLSEYKESFGLVYIEAQISGVPAVGYNDFGVREAIIDKTTGYLVDNEEDVIKVLNEKSYKGLDKEKIVEKASKFCIKEVMKGLLQYVENKNLNVSYIMMQFPSPSETFASNDVKELCKLGINVNVFSLKPSHKNFKAMVQDRDLKNIKCSSSGIKEYILGFMYIFKYLLSFLKLVRWLIISDLDKPKHLLKMFFLIPPCFFIFEKLKKNPPDIVHLFWGHYPSIVGFLVKRNLPQVKLSMFLGAYDLEYKLGVSASLLKETDFVFTHAKANMKQLHELGVDTNRVSIVHRGTRCKKFLSIFENGKKDDNLWLSVGRLLPSKGFDKVLQVFKEYKDKNSKAKLLILGDGPYRKKLSEMACSLGLKDSVQLGGYVEQKEVIKYMGRAGVFLLLSSKEGERLPNVLKEAMLAKCICVSSCTPGINELIENGVNGFIIDEKNYHQIVNLIVSLSNMYKNKMRENAQNTILENFDIEITIKKYLKIWESKHKILESNIDANQQ